MPLLVQFVPGVLLALEPAVIFTAPLFEQVFTSVPATAVGPGVIDNVFVDVTEAQPVFPLTVSLIVTLPARISAALGLYFAFVKDVVPVKVPVPLLLQRTLTSLLALAPTVIFTGAPFEQVVSPVPAIDPAGLLIVNFLVELFAEQEPFPSAVNMIVTLPAAVSAALA